MTTPTRTLSAPRSTSSHERGARVAKLLELLTTGTTAGLLGAPGDAVRKAAVADPMGTLAATVVSAAAVFYAAEKGKNPKVRSFHDALVFVSTSFSVGYSDIFAKTKVGKLVASFVMTLGPSLSARALDAPDTGGAREKDTSVDELVASQRALTASVEALVRALTTRERDTKATRRTT